MQKEPRGWVNSISGSGEVHEMEIVSGRRCVEIRIVNVEGDFWAEIFDRDETHEGGTFSTLAAAKITAERIARRLCWHVYEGVV